MRAIIICVGLLFLFNAATVGQQTMIKGQVYDLETNLPIETVLVMIANTSEGTVTDQEGNFSLKAAGKPELLLTHLAYQPRLINVSSTEPIRVGLKPITTKLSEVEITHKDDKQWKRRSRAFQKGLLGNTRNASKCQFENLWVVEFEDVANGYVASASDVIKLTNKGLGYDVSFLLESFRKDAKGISYGLKPVFTELDGEGAWGESRDRAFYGSKRHFFIALAHDKLDEEGFRIYKAELDQRMGLFDQDRRYKASDIYAEGQLSFDGFVKVVYSKEPPESTYTFSRSANKQVSYLSLRKQHIELDMDGVLSEPHMLLEYGYWSWEGIAELLPHNYLPEGFESRIKAKPSLTKGGFTLTNLIIPYDEIKSGGPPKNGIPALHFPEMISASEASYLSDRDQVLGIEIEGKTLAYPIKILDWHEIVNDKIGNQNFVITYCPLCASGVAFESKVDDKVLKFQVSGLLYNSDVLMYDTQTESLWSQLESKAVSGDYSGTTLKMLPVIQTSWMDWKSSHPGSKVLSSNTGHNIDYDQLAYASYRQSEKLMFAVDTLNNQLGKKELVFGLESNGQFKAYPVSKLNQGKSQFEDMVGNHKLILEYDKSEEKLSVFDSQGERHPVVKLYWFAWFAFHPNTTVY